MRPLARATFHPARGLSTRCDDPAKPGKRVTLDGEILLVGRDPHVAPMRTSLTAAMCRMTLLQRTLSRTGFDGDRDLPLFQRKSPSNRPGSHLIVLVLRGGRMRAGAKGSGSSNVSQ